MPFPIWPGDVFKRMLAHTNWTQDEIAEAIGTSRFTVNQLMRHRRAVTPDMAWRLSRATATKPEFWMDLQRDVDLFYSPIRLTPTRIKVLI